MHHYEKKNSKIFSPEGPRDTVSPGPAVALDWNVHCKLYFDRRSHYLHSNKSTSDTKTTTRTNL